jgi:hypothetical protein
MHESRALAFRIGAPTRRSSLIRDTNAVIGSDQYFRVTIQSFQPVSGPVLFAVMVHRSDTLAILYILNVCNAQYTLRPRV